MNQTLPIGSWRRVPITSGLIILSIVGGIIPVLDPGGNYWNWLGFPQLLHNSTTGSVTVTGGLWQLWTPAILHFGTMHLVFNCLALWLLAAPLELVRGKWRLILLVLLAALISNASQYWFSGISRFGGMSGVVFALCGYLAIWNRWHKFNPIPVPQSLLTLFIIWLVIGFTGLLEKLFGLHIANTAHLAGLLVGMVLVLPDIAVSRLIRR